MGCLLILLCNIGIPNDLQGFLFFAQVVGFVYQNGALDDGLQWVMPGNTHKIDVGLYIYYL